ncbi:hypothetical protein HWB51_gp105 [Mycobacterium phage Cuke]|uniref:Uncharacterized protein n=1 Tax=Mycobacterium phage Cuke TaxID=2079417 RepID=A0A2L1IWZ1_9CAUD|nr:hypothetical protein HWB51_gp105 [Mycobacterium phage Cuke]AVD99707.1 hypothetical protein SEA_CUKE_91 [Mycobacterium phage Cuke]
MSNDDFEIIDFDDLPESNSKTKILANVDQLAADVREMLEEQVMEPGLILTVTQDNPLFKQVLSAIGNLSEDENGHLIFTKPVAAPRIQRAKLKVQIEDGEPVTYVFNLQKGSTIDANRGLMLETYWETSDAIHRKL